MSVGEARRRRAWMSSDGRFVDGEVVEASLLASPASPPARAPAVVVEMPVPKVQAELF